MLTLHRATLAQSKVGSRQHTLFTKAQEAMKEEEDWGASTGAYTSQHK